MSPHQRYRSRLAALAQADWNALVPGSDAAGGGWRRISGRFQPGGSPWALLVLERTEPRQQILRVGVLEGPASLGEVAVPELGALRFSPLAPDPCLPALGEALRGPGETTVVRYRPFRRCTLRAEAGDEVTFVKVFPDDRARELQRQAAALNAASDRGELGFAVAAAGRLAAGGQVLAQPLVAGSPVVDRLRNVGAAALANQLGRALGTLHDSRIDPGRALDRIALDERLERDLVALRERVPSLAGMLAELALAIRALVERAPRSPLAPIHGSPHASQWLAAAGERLALVDFDRICLGPPEFDVATFQGEHLFERGCAEPAPAVNAAFAAGVAETGRRLDPALLRAYLGQKALAKALRSASAVRADGDDAARRHLVTARAAVEVAP